jgi:glycosyltransferase involved in cell wall biosynthesis
MEYINMGRKDVRTLEEFDRFVKSNKASDNRWNHRMKDKQLRELSESDARNYFVKLEEEERALADKIVLASTWNINCGIATYTKYLFDSLDIVAPGSFAVNPINDGVLKYNSRGRLTHLQHEFGIAPEPPKVQNQKTAKATKLIITWHTVSKRTDTAIEDYESDYDVIAHIVHSEHVRFSIDSSKDIWTVPHGSMLIPQMRKEDARRLLGIDVDMPIGFVFGFQSGDKNYWRLIDAARNTGIHLIISGAPRNIASSVYIPNDENVTFVNRFLTENDVNLYALASDILLFDYVSKDHSSVSGAMHRIIGAGRPAICSDVKHFSDIEHGYDCLKFRDQKGLEKCIKLALENGEQLGLAARDYAQRTSWEKIARRHIDIYRRYTNI